MILGAQCVQSQCVDGEIENIQMSVVCCQKFCFSFAFFMCNPIYEIICE